ncbi:hypothetical protein EES40_30285 [Streptomyces sp. ADI93-02]|nr:hypothetical protein EES40_30285 [Streptomyces sp. ADI93-02]
MAATLATYAAVQLVLPLWVREHLAPTTTVTAPFTPDRLANYALDSVSHVEFGKSDVWVTAEQTLDGTGPPPPTACRPDTQTANRPRSASAP